MPKLSPSPLRSRQGYEALQRRIQNPLQWAVSLAALATVPILIAQERGDERFWVVLADWAVWAVFLVEFLLMGLCAADRRRYVRRSWLSALVVALSFPALPHLLTSVRFLRLTRLVQFIKIFRVLAVTARGMGALRRSSGGRGLLYVASLSALLTVAGGALLALLEPENVETGFWGGLWWAVVTVTTVGYGDISPTTAAGRILAVVLMLCGLGLISTLAASISSVFVGAQDRSDFDELQRRIDHLEGKLDRLLELHEPRADNPGPTTSPAGDADGHPRRPG